MENRINNNKLFAQRLCNEHNKLRKNPECYILILKKVLNLIRRSNILHLKDERPFKTIEGKEAVLEAINYLSSIPKSLIKTLSNRLLKVSDFLCQASLDHAKDIGINGTCSHIGVNDNSHINNRVEKYCDWKGGLAESLDFGTTDIQNIMIKLLICDGDKKRCQRNYIFDPGFIFFGAGYFQHIKYKRCSVISYAGYIQPKNANFSEKELICNYLELHKYFVNKNKEEFDRCINGNIYKEKDKDKDKESDVESEKKPDIKNERDKGQIKVEEKKEESEKISEKDESKENDKSSIDSKYEEKEDKISKNDESKRDENEESITSNNNLIIIEEPENDIEKKEKIKFKEISKKEVERYGVSITETLYRIKEGNYHIIEKEEKIKFNSLEEVLNSIKK